MLTIPMEAIERLYFAACAAQLGHLLAVERGESPLIDRRGEERLGDLPCGAKREEFSGYFMHSVFGAAVAYLAQFFVSRMLVHDLPLMGG